MLPRHLPSTLSLRTNEARILLQSPTLRDNHTHLTTTTTTATTTTTTTTTTKKHPAGLPQGGLGCLHSLSLADRLHNWISGSPMDRRRPTAIELRDGDRCFHFQKDPPSHHRSVPTRTRHAHLCIVDTKSKRHLSSACLSIHRQSDNLCLYLADSSLGQSGLSFVFNRFLVSLQVISFFVPLMKTK